MFRDPLTRLDHILLILAALATVAAASLLAIEPRAALIGWLGAASAFAAVPAGSLCLQAMMKLIPGAWGEQLRLSCEAGCTLALPALIAFTPVLIGCVLIYPWASHAGKNPFQSVWLGPTAFIVRTLLWFGFLYLAGRLLRRRWKTIRVATVSLLVFPVLGSLVAVDWLMTLDPAFASSAFGLQILILSVVLALAALILLRLPIGRAPPRSGVIGALLLTLLLMWAYIQFLCFFINWSPDLPEGAHWYFARAEGGWAIATWLFALLGGTALLLLILPRFRKGRRALITLAAVIAAGKIIEFGWFSVPDSGGIGAIGFLFASAALTSMAFFLLRVGLRQRIAARLPVRANA